MLDVQISEQGQRTPTTVAPTSGRCRSRLLVSQPRVKTAEYLEFFRFPIKCHALNGSCLVRHSTAQGKPVIRKRVASVLAVVTALAIIALGAGCGSGGSGGSAAEAQQRAAQQQAHRLAAHRRAVLARRAQARARRQAARRRARLATLREQRGRETEERQQEALEREQAEEREVEEEAAEESECDPNYEGACLDPNASDYDCEGGSGNGPLYTGEVTVVGVDHYGLDADGDGIGCESE